MLGSGEEYALLKKRTEGIELADSITVDGHKILNVPYDCGMFFTRSLKTLESVFTNPNAAYLASGSDESIPSPLNIGIENSRRFRALPVYAARLSEGSSGFERLVSNMVQLSRRIAAFLRDSPDYKLLPDEKAHFDNIFMIVLFRSKAKALNDVLVDRINETRQLYVSGTAWRGEKAVRIAVSNWMIDVERDFEVVAAILRAVAAETSLTLKRFQGDRARGRFWVEFGLDRLVLATSRSFLQQPSAKLLGPALDARLLVRLLALANQLEVARPLAQQRLRLGRQPCRELAVHLVDAALLALLRLGHLGRLLLRVCSLGRLGSRRLLDYALGHCGDARFKRLATVLRADAEGEFLCEQEERRYLWGHADFQPTFSRNLPSTWQPLLS